MDFGKLLVLDGYANLAESDTVQYTHTLMNLPEVRLRQILHISQISRKFRSLNTVYFFELTISSIDRIQRAMQTRQFLFLAGEMEDC